VAEPFWALRAEEVLGLLGATADGLVGDEARRRRQEFGPNRLRRGHGAGAWTLLARQYGSPLVLLLVAAAGVSLLAGDRADAAIVLSIVVASGIVGFWQERSADAAVGELLRRVALRATVLRDGREQEVAVEELVPGDVVRLAAGSLVPADLRLLAATSLYVDQAALTGETFPVEKTAAPAAAAAPPAERASALFSGTHVVSGTGTAVVVRTGHASELGRLASRLAERRPPPAFEQGLQRFGFMLLRVTALMLAGIFAATVYLERPVLEALLFALALAVGITPELLPAIVAVNLARGAKRMAARQVIVKRLAAIENLGSMDVLCCDKTGTLTEGRVHLRRHVAADGRPSPEVLAAAALNAALQRGLPSPLDETIRAESGVEVGGYRKLDEVPYDFSRRRLSVLVEGPDGRRRLLTKGALAEVLAASSEARLADGRRVPLAEVRERVGELFAAWSEEGLRVLGVAERPLAGVERATAADEEGLTFLGLIAFSDVPKAGAAEAVAGLGRLGIALKIITGDNRKVAVTLARAVGLSTPRVLTGADLVSASTPALAALAAAADVFAEVEPTQKERIILALRHAGHVVGFLGDGINDAPALHVADVGISVDGAVDVAKEAAEIVLLEHDLRVLAEGVRQGRSTFLNTLKYIYITTSANFGNMLSMAVAVLFLPFLPLLPKQILLNNFLSDFPAMTLGADRVDPEAASRPRRWDMRFVRRFMVVFGVISSLFDLLTFGVLLLVVRASAEGFRTAWFAVSLLTEVTILLVMRTRRPFLRSRPARGLVVACGAVAAATLALPYLPPLARLFGFVPLPPPLVAAVLGITAGYLAVSEAAKHWFFGHSRLARASAAA
jgi:Mg2+-importing ATPase